MDNLWTLSRNFVIYLIITASDVHLTSLAGGGEDSEFSVHSRGTWSSQHRMKHDQRKVTRILVL